MIPDKIDRYDILGEIGRGGMATVYRAYDPNFKREVAVKVLPPEFLHDPTFRARFEREAQAIGALDHPAIVPVYDFGEDKGQLFMVMRLMAGGSLADRMKHGAMSVEQAATLYQRICPALDEAHKKGIVHRDLKPGNILFDQRGDPAVGDFGIAKVTEGGPSALSKSLIIGTPAYMSPEQANGEGDIDGRSDTYTLGAILFELLTGQPPYQADTPIGIAIKHIVEPVPRILDTNPYLPPGVQAVVEKAMAKKRDERFATATELAAALASAAKGETVIPGRARMATVQRPSDQAAQAPTGIRAAGPAAGGRRAPWAIIVVVAIVVLGIGALVVSQSAAPAPTPTPLPSDTPVPPTATSVPSPDTPTPIPPSPTPEALSVVANTDAGIFAQPNSDSALLGGVRTGETATILGRAESTKWLYLQNEEGIEGFAWQPYFDFAGDVASLPVIVVTPSAAPTRVAAPTGGELDFTWEIVSEGANPADPNQWEIVVVVQATGGDGQYTFYHDGLEVDGPTIRVVFAACRSKPGSLGVEDGSGTQVTEDYFLDSPYCNKTPSP